MSAYPKSSAKSADANAARMIGNDRVEKYIDDRKRARSERRLGAKAISNKADSV
jgi:hypothetical protein